MIKCYPLRSVQRSQLAEAIAIASKIAKCEPNEHTIRATVLYCLERNVEGFPANLFNNNRTFIDSIDVDEADHRPTHASTSASLSSISTASSSVTSNASSLHCTLFLFDDKLMVVKRQSSSISGRKVTGLDDMQKLVKSGGGVAVMDKSGTKKDKLSFRGAVDILDVIATDVGGGGSSMFRSLLAYESISDQARLQPVPRETPRSVRTMGSAAQVLTHCSSTLLPLGSGHGQAR
jgi:hypothetical protein